jgi:hypothetical protein
MAGMLAPQHAVPFHSFAMNWNASIDPADALATMKNPLATMKIFLEAPVVSDALQKHMNTMPPMLFVCLIMIMMMIIIIIIISNISTPLQLAYLTF